MVPGYRRYDGMRMWNETKGGTGIWYQGIWYDGMRMWNGMMGGTGI